MLKIKLFLCGIIISKRLHLEMLSVSFRGGEKEHEQGGGVQKNSCLAAGEWTGSKPKTFTISFFLSQVFLDGKGYASTFSSLKVCGKLVIGLFSLFLILRYDLVYVRLSSSVAGG